MEIWELLSKINAPELQARLFWVRVLFIAITALFLAIIAISVWKTPYLRLSIFGDAVEVLTYRPYGMHKIRKRWQQIMRRLESASEAEYKLAIIEADILLDEFLKKMRVDGETVDERLQNVSEVMLSNAHELREAHEVRNSVAHDPDYRLSLAEARRVLLLYQRSFENLDLFR